MTDRKINDESLAAAIKEAMSYSDPYQCLTRALEVLTIPVEPEPEGWVESKPKFETEIREFKKDHLK